MSKLRQKLLVLYTMNSMPDTKVIAWSVYDGSKATPKSVDYEDKAPYETVLEAMQDGWRVIQYPPLQTDPPGKEYETTHLKFEFVLEQLVDIDE